MQAVYDLHPTYIPCFIFPDILCSSYSKWSLILRTCCGVSYSSALAHPSTLAHTHLPWHTPLPTSTCKLLSSKTQPRSDLFHEVFLDYWFLPELIAFCFALLVCLVHTFIIELVTLYWYCLLFFLINFEFEGKDLADLSLIFQNTQLQRRSQGSQVKKALAGSHKNWTEIYQL